MKKVSLIFILILIISFSLLIISLKGTKFELTSWITLEDEEIIEFLNSRDYYQACLIEVKGLVIPKINSIKIIKTDGSFATNPGRLFIDPTNNIGTESVEEIRKISDTLISAEEFKANKRKINLLIKNDSSLYLHEIEALRIDYSLLGIKLYKNLNLR